MLILPLGHSINFFLNGVMVKSQLRSCMKSITVSRKDKLNLYLHPNLHKKLTKNKIKFKFKKNGQTPGANNNNKKWAKEEKNFKIAALVWKYLSSKIYIIYIIDNLTPSLWIQHV